MASAAAAPRPPAPSPPPPPAPPAPAATAAAVQWLGPRVSFSIDDASGSTSGGGGREAAVAAAAAVATGGTKAGLSTGAGAEFEFLLGGCAAACSMLPADELFSGGKLVPLRIPAPAADETAGVHGVEVDTEELMARQKLLLLRLPPKQEQQTPAHQLPETPRAAEAKGAAEVPKIPARRWRDLLRLRKQQAAATASGSAATEQRPLRRLLRRGPKPPDPEPSLSLPLLREPAGPEEPDTTKPADKTAPAPAVAPTSSSSQHHQSQLPPKIRLSPSASQQQQASASASSTSSSQYQYQSQSPSPSPPPPPPPPPPPSGVAADSPRLNAAGKVVFNGLGRSSSSPSSLAGGRRHHRTTGPGGMERSYSAHVRVTPVLNVPVCSLRGSRKSVSVFGIDRLFSSPSSSSAAGSASSSAVGAARKIKAAAKKDAHPAGAAAGAQ